MTEIALRWPVTGDRMHEVLASRWQPPHTPNPVANSDFQVIAIRVLQIESCRRTAPPRNQFGTQVLLRLNRDMNSLLAVLHTWWWPDDNNPANHD
jgi:hypothetical protein